MDFHRASPLAPRPQRRIDPPQVANGWHKMLWRRGQTEIAQTDPLNTDRSRSPKLARLEAALFVANGALSVRKLVQVATLEDVKEAQSLIDELNILLDADDSAFRVEKVASGVRLLTRPTLASWLDRLHHRQQQLKLSAPAMETLSVIAYRQPCTRADVEAIRGVQAAEMIKQLMERNLVRVVGEDDSLGRPYLYGTTKLFLESYGLGSLNELPMADSLAPRTVEQDSERAPDESEQNTSDEETRMNVDGQPEDLG